MDTLIDFLINNYLWILVISLILIFALIGYLVDASTPKSKIKKIAKMPEEAKKQVHPSVEAYTNEDFDEPLIH